VSVAVTSHGEYGVPEGLTSLPHSRRKATVRGESKRVSTSTMFAKDGIKITTDELMSERDEVRSLGLI